MAYNNGFPMNYPYYQQPIMQQPVMPQQMQQQIQPQGQQYQTVQSGFVRVRNENEARMYPVSPGHSVTFIDENGPFCYAKTVNIGQLDRPIFEKYRLVKEDDAPASPEAQQAPLGAAQNDLDKYALKDDVAAFRADLDAMKADIEAFRGDLYGLAGKKTSTRKKEAVSDE